MKKPTKLAQRAAQTGKKKDIRRAAVAAHVALEQALDACEILVEITGYEHLRLMLAMVADEQWPLRSCLTDIEEWVHEEFDT